MPGSQDEQRAEQATENDTEGRPQCFAAAIDADRREAFGGADEGRNASHAQSELSASQSARRCGHPLIVASDER